MAVLGRYMSLVTLWFSLVRTRTPGNNVQDHILRSHTERILGVSTQFRRRTHFNGKLIMPLFPAFTNYNIAINDVRRLYEGTIFSARKSEMN